MAGRPPQLASTSSSATFPKFFLHSPPSDAGDSSSEEGDTLHTPPNLAHQPNLFNHMNTQFTFRYPAHDKFLEIPKCVGDASRQSRPLSPLSPVFTPAALKEQRQSYAQYSAPTKALDLANASIELDPFAASFLSHCEGQSESPSVHFPERPSLCRLPMTDYVSVTKARMHSPRFPADHYLDSAFVRAYSLEDELGSGGYGFVMTARHRIEMFEVAVKFIIKAKVPDNAWMDDEILGRVPTEVLLLSLVNHPNIVRCIDVYEDELYFCLVQELHGTPWTSRKKSGLKQITAPGKLVVPATDTSPPALSPSPSDTTIDSMLPITPPQTSVELPSSKHDIYPAVVVNTNHDHHEGVVPSSASTGFLRKSHLEVMRPTFSRRPSHDLFECIEQSKHKRLSETQTRYIFAQVVEAVWYLDRQGISHRDVKDENLVIDKDFRVKLIDFGSAVVADPTQPRPYYNLFYGTTAYASSEILLRKPYQAAPAEIWTLGVLLSYLLTGSSPFPTEEDAIQGRIVLSDGCGKDVDVSMERSGGIQSGPGKGIKGSTLRVSEGCLGLMRRCLDKDPERRAGIEEVRAHWWVRGAWEAWEGRVRRT